MMEIGFGLTYVGFWFWAYLCWFLVLGLPMMALVLGLSWSPGPSLLMEGPIAPYASHSHGPSP